MSNQSQALTVNMESVAVREYFRSGNVAQLNDNEKDFVLSKLCERYGLDPILRPFDLISFQGGQKFYMTASATNQLANAKGLSREVISMDIDEARMMAKCAVQVSSPDGRKETANGFISIARFLAPTKENPVPRKVLMDSEDLANALLKLETKTKRRATLSFFGVMDSAGDYEDRPASPVVAPDVPRASVVREAAKAAESLSAPSAPKEAPKEAPAPAVGIPVVDAEVVEETASAPASTPSPTPAEPPKRRGRPAKASPQTEGLVLTQNPEATIPTLAPVSIEMAPASAPVTEAPVVTTVAPAPSLVVFSRTSHASYLLAAATEVYGDPAWSNDPAKKDAVKRAIPILDGKAGCFAEGSKSPAPEFVAALRAAMK